MGPSRRYRNILKALLTGSMAGALLLQQPAVALDLSALFDREAPAVETPSVAAPAEKIAPAKTQKAARRETAKARRPARQEEKPAIEAKARLPLFGVVSIGDQHISIYDHNGLVTRSQVSTGMEGHATPRGIFTIVGRERYHESNIYSGAPMPYMQRITWSGIAMHVGVVPGHPASHGCIRLPADFAAKLWGMTRIGERIVIVPDDVYPAAFSHDALPAPRLYAAAGPVMEPPAADAPSDIDAQETPPTRLNPRQYAERLKAKAAAEAVAAAKSLKEAKAAEKSAQQAVAAATRELAAAEAAERAARSKGLAAPVGIAGKSPAVVREAALTSDSLGPYGDAASNADYLGLLKAATAARAADALAWAGRTAPPVGELARLDSASWSLAAKKAELARATAAVSEAVSAAAGATRADADARRRLTSISVLISKKDQRVYVRQGLAPLFVAPITVREPERPLGSHLFIATAATDDATGLQWTSLSMPGTLASASEALERIEMEPEVRKQLGERLWMGASIIVSDQSPSSETGPEGTDLTVKLR